MPSIKCRLHIETWYLLAGKFIAFQKIVGLDQWFSTFSSHGLFSDQYKSSRTQGRLRLREWYKDKFSKFGSSSTFTNFNENPVSEFVSPVRRNKGLWSSMHITWCRIVEQSYDYVLFITHRWHCEENSLQNLSSWTDGCSNEINVQCVLPSSQQCFLSHQRPVFFPTSFKNCQIFLKFLRCLIFSRRRRQ